MTTYATAFERREPFRMEYRLKRADGQYRWVLDTGVSRPTSDGTFTGYIRSCIDITERKSAEQSLRHNEAALLQSYAQIQDLAGRLITAQEAERMRIARDLHDDVCQDLAAVTVDISYLRQHGASLQTRAVQRASDLGSGTHGKRLSRKHSAGCRMVYARACCTSDRPCCSPARHTASKWNDNINYGSDPQQMKRQNRPASSWRCRCLGLRKRRCTTLCVMGMLATPPCRSHAARPMSRCRSPTMAAGSMWRLRVTTLAWAC